MNHFRIFFFLAIFNLGFNYAQTENTLYTYSTNGKVILDTTQVWLSHEHILVDFIGAKGINPKSWNHDSILKATIPFLDELSKFKVKYFVDATPNYLGRDVVLLEKISNQTELKIITNTGFYGAGKDKHMPPFALNMTAKEISKLWVSEFENGIDHTKIRPGFIKIGIDNKSSLSLKHKKLVTAAALTHLKTGLTIASHTGKAKGLWQQIDILKNQGVSPEAFIWVHANQENNLNLYIKAAEIGCWISLDGLGWETKKHIEKLLFAKKHGLLSKILISHDAGWYDPQKQQQNIQPYTNIFKTVIPNLKASGFTSKEIDLLLKINPAKAFSIGIKKYEKRH